MLIFCGVPVLYLLLRKIPIAPNLRLSLIVLMRGAAVVLIVTADVLMHGRGVSPDQGGGGGERGPKINRW